MIKDIKYLINKEYNPFKNIALEEYLFTNIEDGQCILYLWQNEKTVVIGRNQNALKECRVRELEEDGGTLVRRLSGGGAVFHDLGNLNFTFLVKKEDYNVERQLEVILKAVNSFSIPAKKTGRNDITVEEKKFSGNAFYERKGNCYHHGTILVDVDIHNLSHYLNVSKDKLKSKGVESVKSRVTNLRDYNHQITIESMKLALINAFNEVYGLIASEMELKLVNEDELVKLEEKFCSWEWVYGKKLQNSYTMERRFIWGGMELIYQIDGGKISNLMIYTDALDTDFIDEIRNVLLDCIFNTSYMCSALDSLLVQIPEHAEKVLDIKNLIMEEGRLYGI